jgi:F-type H+-transporting ATPase subunit b
MKYVWPPIIKSIHDREKKIVTGLETAERSKRELEMAEHKAFAIIREAKQQAAHIIEQANVQSVQLIEEAKTQGKQEGARMVAIAQDEIGREFTQAKETLKTQVATLAVIGAERIIQANLDPAIHRELLNQLAAEI